MPSAAYNYRMTDVQAAIGREQLKRLAGIIAERRALAAALCRRRSPASTASRRRCEPAWARSNWQSYCVRLDGDLDQRAVMQHMLDRGIATRRGIMCAHLEPAYRDLPRAAPAAAFRGGARPRDHPAALTRP